MATKTRSCNLFDKLCSDISRNIEVAKKDARQNTIDNFLKRFGNKTLFSVFLDPKDERFFRTVTATYEEALAHMETEIFHYVDSSSQAEARQVVETLRSQQPTSTDPLIFCLLPAGKEYSIEITSVDQVMELLEWKEEERLRVENRRHDFYDDL